MAFTLDELGIRDRDLAARILAHARNVIAPGLDHLEGPSREDALAVLRGVARDAQARGLRHVASQKVGSAYVSYRDAASSFSDDDRATLRALCQAVGGGHPVGRFPGPSKAFRRVWPEEDEGV